jgi:hypothetical protein
VVFAEFGLRYERVIRALLLKFRATLWALERIVFFAYHFQSTAETDANLARWAAVVAALNTIAAHAARLG